MFDLFFISLYIYTARGPKDFEEKKKFAQFYPPSHGKEKIRTHSAC
jgi:hypothetical protein